MNEVTSNYDSIVTQYEAAFLAFRRTYELRTPPPVREIAPNSHWLLYASILTIVVASVIVSGSRTIPEFGGNAVGVAAFIMLEVGMILYAYLRTRTDYDRAQHDSLKKRTNQALQLAFAIAVIANVHHTAQAKLEGLVIGDLVIGETVSLIIDLAIGFSAPALAFLAGDILGQQTAMRSHRQKQLDNEYGTAMSEWLEGLNTSWNGQKKKWGADIQISSQPVFTERSVNSLNEQSEYDRSPNSSTGYTKNMSSREVIQNYFNEFPGEIGDPLDKLHQRIQDYSGKQIGRTSIHNVRKELTAHTNGNGKH